MVSSSVPSAHRVCDKKHTEPGGMRRKTHGPRSPEFSLREGAPGRGGDEEGAM